MTGFSSTADLPDTDLDEILRKAQADVVHEIASAVVRLKLDGPLDGANARYRLPPDGSRERTILDEDLSGTTNSSDVVVETRDDTTDPPTWASATVSTVDGLGGEVVLSTPPASSKAGVFLTAYLSRGRIDLENLKDAITYHAAEIAELRVNRPGAVTLANPNVERPSPERKRTSWSDLYRRALRRLKRPRPRSASTDTSLPRADFTRGIALDP